MEMMSRERAMEISEMILMTGLEGIDSPDYEKESIKKILENKDKEECLKFLLDDFRKIPPSERPSPSELAEELDEEGKEAASEIAETIGVTSEEVSQFVIYLHSNI